MKKRCSICQKIFDATGRHKTCGEGCRKKLTNYRASKWYHKNRKSVEFRKSRAELSKKRYWENKES